MNIRNIPRKVADRAIACLPSHPLDRALLAAATIAAPITIALPSWEGRLIAAPIAPIALAVADHRRDRRRLEGYKSRVMALETEQRDHLDTVLAMTKNAESERDRLEEELSAALTKSAALGAALSAAREKITVLESEQSQWQEWEQGAIEDRHRLEIERAKLESDRQVAALELQGKIDRANGEMSAVASELERAKAEITHLAQSLRDHQVLVSKLRAEIDGFEDLESQMESMKSRHDLAVSRLNLKITELTKAQEYAESIAAVERDLKNIGDVIGTDLRPLLICGGQNAGKGTMAINLIHHYGAGSGAIALALDPGEGGAADSTWGRAGIPSVASPHEFLEFCRAVNSELENGNRAHRASPEYAGQPPIIAIVDELTTAFSGLSNPEIEELLGYLRAFQTRGQKYKVFVAYCTQNEQIQNLRYGTRHQVLNSGQIGGFWRIWINDVLLEYCEKNPSQVSDVMAQYLDVNRQKYVAAAVGFEGGCKVLIPIRHPSHHGQILGSRDLARPLPSPRIVTPGWLPQGLQGAFCPTGDGDGPNPSPFAPEPLPALARTPERGQDETGEFDPFGPMERAERSAIIRLLEQSMGRAAIARALYGVSKGASPRYAAARSKIDEVAAELSNGIFAK